MFNLTYQIHVGNYLSPTSPNVVVHFRSTGKSFSIYRKPLYCPKVLVIRSNRH